MPLRTLSRVPPAPGAYAPLGAMNSQISLLAPGERAGDGGPGTPDAAVGPVWASIRPLGGAETDRQHQRAQTSSHLVEIFYQLGITENMIVSFQDGGNLRTFQIRYVDDPDGLRNRLHLYCAEVGQNAGGAS
jgi:SPP1 family predicted phage head-tail adaptor